MNLNGEMTGAFNNGRCIRKIVIALYSLVPKSKYAVNKLYVGKQSI